MDFITPEIIEKFINPKDLVNIGILWFLMKGRVATHFKAIETSLVTIGENIQSLKDSIVKLEETQTRKINELAERVTKLEGED